MSHFWNVFCTSRFWNISCYISKILFGHWTPFCCVWSHFMFWTSCFKHPNCETFHISNIIIMKHFIFSHFWSISCFEHHISEKFYVSVIFLKHFMLWMLRLWNISCFEYCSDTWHSCLVPGHKCVGRKVNWFTPLNRSGTRAITNTEHFFTFSAF